MGPYTGLSSDGPENRTRSGYSRTKWDNSHKAFGLSVTRTRIGSVWSGCRVRVRPSRPDQGRPMRPVLMWLIKPHHSPNTGWLRPVRVSDPIRLRSDRVRGQVTHQVCIVSGPAALLQRRQWYYHNPPLNPLRWIRVGQLRPASSPLFQVWLAPWRGLTTSQTLKSNVQ